MDTEILAQLKRALDAEKSRLSDSLISHFLALHGKDYSQQTTAALIAQSCQQQEPIRTEGKRLEQVDAALCALDLEIYGLCADCESEISLADLQNDPAEQRCRQCRESSHYFHGKSSLKSA